MLSESESFDQLVDDYYRAWLRFYPDQALALGDKRFAEHLRSSEDSDCGALKNLDANFIDGLESLDLSALDADRRLDGQVAYGAALLELEYLVEQNWRKRDPAAYLPTYGIFQLLLRDVDGLETLLRSRLKKTPAYLQSAALRLQSNAHSVAPFWLWLAVEDARAGAGYLNQITEHPGVVPIRDDSLDRLIADASGAMFEYARFLDEHLRPVAAGSVAAGPRYFNNIIRFRHGLDIDHEAIESLGERLAHEAREELSDVCCELGAEDVSGAARQLARRHPAGADKASMFRDWLGEAEQFFRHSGLMTLPDFLALEVVEAPDFLRRRVPGAAYLRPLPDDPRQRAWLLVSSSDLPDSLPEIAHMAVHEGPGRHLQCVSANGRAVSKTYPRLLNGSASVYEGWATYVEQLAWGSGFFSTPEDRFLVLRNRLWNALRILLDIGIHTHDVSPENAIDLLVRQIGISEDRALAEVGWYTRYPGAPMGYSLGCLLIETLRDVLRERSETFDVRQYHDTLLSTGSVGLGYVIPRHWGGEVWGQVKARVFRL